MQKQIKLFSVFFILIGGTLLYNNHMSISTLEKQMFNTEGFLRGYYLNNTPDSFRIDDGAEIVHSVPTMPYSEIDLQIKFSRNTNGYLKRPGDTKTQIDNYCSTNRKLRPTISFEFLDSQMINKFLVGNVNGPYILNLTPTLLNCFKNVIIRPIDTVQNSRILVDKASKGLVKIDDNLKHDLDLRVENIQLDYLKHPYLQGKITSVVEIDGKYNLALTLDTVDSLGKNSEGNKRTGWESDRSFYTADEIIGCKSSYATLYKKYIFPSVNNRESIEKKKNTQAHFSFSRILKTVESGSNNKVSLEGILPLRNSKINGRRDSAQPEVEDKVVVFCDFNQNKPQNAFRISNIRNYSFDNVTVNSSGKVAVYAGHNYGKGTFNKFFVKKWHWKSNRIVNAKSGFLVSGNRGPVHLSNSIIVRTFDDGFNTYTPAYKLAKLLRVELRVDPTTEEQYPLYHFCVETNSITKPGDFIHMYTPHDGVRRGSLKVVSNRKAISACKIHDIQLKYIVFKREVADSTLVSLLSNYNTRRGGNFNLAYDASYITKQIRFDRINKSLEDMHSMGDAQRYNNLSRVNHGKYLIGFNANSAGSGTIVEKSVIGANRHAAIALKSPNSEIKNNVILLGDFYPIHMPTRLEVYNPEGMAPLNSKVMSNFIDSHSGYTEGVKLYTNGSEINGSKTSSIQKYESGILIGENQLSGCGEASTINTGNYIGITERHNRTEDKEYYSGDPCE